jgi:hypothetical protein
VCRVFCACSQRLSSLFFVVQVLVRLPETARDASRAEVYGNEIEAGAGKSDSAGGEKAEGLASVGEVMKRRRDQERIIQERIFRRGL